MLDSISARPLRARPGWPTRAPHRRTGRQGGRSARTTSPGSRAGSTSSTPSCRRCGASSWPADRQAGAALHVARTVCRRAERAMVALGAGRRGPELLVYVNRLSDLLFVWRGPSTIAPACPKSSGERRPRARRRRCLRARRARRAHYENFPVASRLLPAAMRRTSRRSTPSPAAPTTSPTNPATPTPSGSRCSTTGRAPPRGVERRLAVDSRPARRTRCSSSPSPTRCALRAAARAVRRSAERLPPGRHRDPLRRPGPTCSTIAALGEPGRPAGAARSAIATTRSIARPTRSARRCS